MPIDANQKMSQRLIAKHLEKIKASPTLVIAEKAAKMKASGLNVIGLSAGEPDFDTPSHIKEAAIKALSNGKTKYTPVEGTSELKGAIKAKFIRENNLQYEPEQIIASTGAKQVIFNAFAATLNPRDEVIIPAPFWVSYPDMVLLAQGKPVIVPSSIENQFKLQASDLEKAITPNTKWIILNSPSNPTGAAYSAKETRELAQVILKHPDIYVLADDIYEHIVYNNFKFCTLAEVEPALKDRVLTVNGVSKAYAMTGWRIGYGAGPKQLIVAMSVIQSQSTSNPCSISQAAAVEALNGPQDCVRANALVFEKRLNLVKERLSVLTDMKCVTPEGAFYLFLSCEGAISKKTPKGKVIKNDLDFAGYLLEEALVAVVPGSAFGADNFFRISYATSEANLEEACARIVKYYRELK